MLRNCKSPWLVGVLYVGLALSACSSDGTAEPDGGDGGVSPGDGPGGPAVYHYATSALLLPNTEGYAADLDGDGTPDNQFQKLVSLLSLSYDLQGAVDRSVAAGNGVLLLDVQAQTLADGSPIVVLAGASPAAAESGFSGAFQPPRSRIRQARACAY